jgi:hypothetical protein
MNSGVFMAEMRQVSVTIAKTLVQIDAPATKTIEIIRAEVSFSSIASTAIEVGLKKVTTAGTKTGFTPIRLQGAAAAASAGTNNTVEGTSGDLLMQWYVNYLSGLVYFPAPEERIILAPSERIALYLPSAPGAGITIDAFIVWGESG